MADYPTGVYAPRTKANKAGVVYDALKTTVGYAEDIQKLDAEVVAIETELGASPKGGYASVVARLNALLEKAGGTLTGPIVLGAGIGINLTLPTTNAQCTGHFTDSFQSGYTASAGDLVYFGSGGKWLEVDADAVATCKGLIGIALEAKNDGQAMKVALPGSFVHFDAWTWTVGDTLYAGETLGAIQNAIPTGADAIIKVVGFAIDADTIFFNPSPDQQSVVA